MTGTESAFIDFLAPVLKDSFFGGLGEIPCAAGSDEEVEDVAGDGGDAADVLSEPENHTRIPSGPENPVLRSTSNVGCIIVVREPNISKKSQEVNM